MSEERPINLKRYEEIRTDGGMDLPKLCSNYSRKGIEFILTFKRLGIDISVVDPDVIDIASNEQERDLLRRTFMRFGVRFKGEKPLTESRELIPIIIGRPIPEPVNARHDYIILSDDGLKDSEAFQNEVISIMERLEENPLYKKNLTYNPKNCEIRDNILGDPTDFVCFNCESRKDCDVYIPTPLVFVNSVGEDIKDKLELDFKSYISTIEHEDVTEDASVLTSANLVYKSEILDYNLYKERLERLLSHEGTLLITDKDSDFQKISLVNLATELILQHDRTVICSRRSLPNLLDSLYAYHPHIDLPLYEKIKVYSGLSKVGIKYESAVKSLFLYVLRENPKVRVISKRTFKFDSEDMKVQQEVDIDLDKIITPQEAGMTFSYDRDLQVKNRDMLAPYFGDTVDLNNTLFTKEDGEIFIHTDCTLNVEVTADMICYESDIQGIGIISVTFKDVECNSLLPINTILIDEEKVKELLHEYSITKGKKITSTILINDEIDLSEYKKQVEKEIHENNLKIIETRYNNDSLGDRIKNFETLTNILFKKQPEEARTKIINNLKAIAEMDFKKMYSTLGSNKTYSVIRDAYIKSEMSKTVSSNNRAIYQRTGKKKLKEITDKLGLSIRYGTPYDKIAPEQRSLLNSELYKSHIEDDSRVRANRDFYLKNVENLTKEVVDFYMPNHPIHLIQYLVAGDIEKFYKDAYSYLSTNLLRGSFKSHYDVFKNKRIFNSLMEMGEFGYPPIKKKALRDSNISSEKRELARLHVCPRS